MSQVILSKERVTNTFLIKHISDFKDYVKKITLTSKRDKECGRCPYFIPSSIIFMKVIFLSIKGMVYFCKASKLEHMHTSLNFMSKLFAFPKFSLFIRLTGMQMGKRQQNIFWGVVKSLWHSARAGSPSV